MSYYSDDYNHNEPKRRQNWSQYPNRYQKRYPNQQRRRGHYSNDYEHRINNDYHRGYNSHVSYNNYHPKDQSYYLKPLPKKTDKKYELTIYNKNGSYTNNRMYNNKNNKNPNYKCMNMPTEHDEVNFKRIIKQFNQTKNKYPRKQHVLLICMRNAHYKSVKDPEAYKTPQLTDMPLDNIGIKEAQRGASRFKALKDVANLVILSPLTRAVQTGLHGCLKHFEDDNNNKNKNNAITNYKIPVAMLDYAREKAYSPSYTVKRKSLTEIKQQWRNYNFSYDGFYTNEDTLWKKDKWESWKSFDYRTDKFLRYIFDFQRNNGGDVIIYMGHWGTIKNLMKRLGVEQFTPKHCGITSLIIQRNKFDDF